VSANLHRRIGGNRHNLIAKASVSAKPLFVRVVTDRLFRAINASGRKRHRKTIGLAMVNAAGNTGKRIANRIAKTISQVAANVIANESRRRDNPVRNRQLASKRGGRRVDAHKTPSVSRRHRQNHAVDAGIAKDYSSLLRN
jgi:hypothetical protein